MLNKLSNVLKGWAQGWIIILLFLLDSLFMGFIMPIAGKLIKGAAGGPGVFDLRFFTPPAKTFEMIAAYGEYNRTFYRNFELTIDILYPIVYTLFLSLLITWLFKKGFSPDGKIQKLNVMPFGIWLFDLLENLGIATMLSVYPAMPAIVAWLTTIFTMLKWSFAGASMIVVMLGIIANLTRKK
jgi:hypothetical protein